jgi:hypothetical protein
MTHEKVQKPVLLPVAAIIYKITGYCQPHETMHFVFDEDRRKMEIGDAMRARFLASKNELKEDNDPFSERMGSFEFADSKKALPLQAADLLAYECHRYAKGLEKKHPMRNEYRRALSRMRSIDDFWLFDERRMESLAREFDKTDAKLGKNTR